MNVNALPPSANANTVRETLPSQTEWSQLVFLSNEHSTLQNSLKQSMELLAFQVQQCELLDPEVGKLAAENAWLVAQFSQRFPQCNVRGHALEALQSDDDDDAYAFGEESQLLEPVGGYLHSLQPQRNRPHNFVSMPTASPPVAAWYLNEDDPSSSGAASISGGETRVVVEADVNASSSPSSVVQTHGMDSSRASFAEFTAFVPASAPASAVKCAASSLPPQGVTTLVVRNIPLQYTQETLLEQWYPDGSFNYLHVPYNRVKNCIFGIAFINFTSYETMCDFYVRWHGRMLPGRTIGNSLNLAVAVNQGRLRNVMLLKRRNVANIDARFHPAVFDGSVRVDFRTFVAMLSNRDPGVEQRMAIHR